MEISADYVITPVTISSLISTLISFYILSPVLSKKFFQQYNSFTEDKKIYWNSLPCSTIHAVAVCTVIVIIFLDGSILNDYIPYSKCKLGFLPIQLTFGYLSGDLIIMLSHISLRSDTVMIVHHISILITFFLSLAWKGRCMMLMLLHDLGELSTPFVNLHWLFIETKTPKNSWLAITNSFGMTITFLGSRVFPIPLQIYLTYFCLMKELDLSLYLNIFLVLLGTTQYCLNIFWGYKVARGFLKFLKLKILKSKKD